MPKRGMNYCFRQEAAAEGVTKHMLYIYDSVRKYGKFNWQTWQYEDAETSAKRFRDLLDEIPDGENIELIEVVENRKKLPLPFIILKFETPREIKFYDMENATTSDFIYREDMLTMKAFSKHTRRIKAKCRINRY